MMMTAPVGTQSVLVVDDDVDICQNIHDILTDRGYRADVAHNAGQALAMLRQHDYRIALIDFKMPGMDGAALNREIKKLHPDVVTIMVTGFATEEAMSRLESDCIAAVCYKPLDVDKLLNTLQSFPS